MITPELKQLIQRLPKAELHCHLEGAIRPATLIDLAARHQISLPFADVAGAEKFYEFTSLNQFLGIFALACGTLQTAADFETITLDLGADAAAQNILYREVFFTYAYHDRRGIPWSEVVQGIAAGRARAREQYGVDLWFIADIDRTIDPADGVRLVEMAHASRAEAGIIGIGLDSQEIGYPARRHQPAFQRAAELGLHRVAHAGEDVGPESVWDAIESLQVERVDHGVRSIDDPRLVRFLADKQIPLTVCPLSNVDLKVYPALAAHPVKRLLDAGVLVTLNSDDPPMFHSNLVDNYVAVADCFDLGAGEVIELARNGFAASFLGEATRMAALERFSQEVTVLRRAL